MKLIKHLYLACKRFCLDPAPEHRPTGERLAGTELDDRELMELRSDELHKQLMAFATETEYIPNLKPRPNGGKGRTDDKSSDK